MKKNYISPEIRIESLQADANFALVCGPSVGSKLVSCVRKTAPVEYEMLMDALEFLDIDPSTPLSELAAQNILFSSDVSCFASCYQGPYDNYFSS